MVTVVTTTLTGLFKKTLFALGGDRPIIPRPVGSELRVIFCFMCQKGNLNRYSTPAKFCLVSYINSYSSHFRVIFVKYRTLAQN